MPLSIGVAARLALPATRLRGALWVPAGLSSDFDAATSIVSALDACIQSLEVSIARKRISKSFARGRMVKCICHDPFMIAELQIVRGLIFNGPK